MDGIDITPEESVVPVFLVEQPEPVYEEVPDLEAIAQQQQALRQSGVEKLMGLGLTEEEARAIAGA